MISGIYGYWDNYNDEMVYIGQSVNLKKRIGAHFEPSRYNCQRINRVLQSNPKRYTPHILKECSIDELDHWEITLIALYNPKFNFANGGKVNRGFTLSDETKQKISNSLKGPNSYWYGKEFSEDHKRRLSESHKGNTLSEETRKKLSRVRKGKKLSKEHRLKLKEVHTGKRHTEETKNKFRQLRNKTGFYGVCKEKTKERKSGFILRYTYHDNDGKRKRISSISILKLKEKVLSKGLKWEVTNEALAKQTIQNEMNGVCS